MEFCTLLYLYERNVGSFHSPKKGKVGKISLKKRVILLFLVTFNAFLFKNNFNEIEKIAKLCQHSSKRHFSCFFHRSNLKKKLFERKRHEKTQKKVKNAYNLVFFIIFFVFCDSRFWISPLQVRVLQNNCERKSYVTGSSGTTCHQIGQIVAIRKFQYAEEKAAVLLLLLTSVFSYIIV